MILAAGIGKGTGLNPGGVELEVVQRDERRGETEEEKEKGEGRETNDRSRGHPEVQQENVLHMILRD